MMYASTLRQTMIAFVALLGLSLPAASHAATIYVNDDAPSGGLRNGTSWFNAFLTIQDAIDAASPHDTILIAAGTYPEFLWVGTSDLTFRGAGAGLTVLTNPGGATSGVSVMALGTTTFESMTLTGYNSHAIENYTATELVVLDCELVNNYQALMFNHGAGRVEGSVFQNNYSAIWMKSTNTGIVKIIGNQFIDNRFGVRDWPNGGGASTWIGENRFEGTIDQAILLRTEEGSALVWNNFITEGAAGISIRAGQHLVFNNIIEGNTGHAIEITGSTSTVIHNTIVGNGGTGIRCHTDVWPDTSSVSNNALLDNDRGFEGALGCQAKLQTNAAYGSATADISGSYVNLGGNLAGVYFALKADYGPATSRSPLINAGTWNPSALLRHDYWGRSRDNPPEIGAVEYVSLKQ